MLVSTRNIQLSVSLEEAVLKGLAEDGGLFIPLPIPRLSESFFETIDQLSFTNIAIEVAKSLLHGMIDEKVIVQVIEDSLRFDAPLKHIENEIYALELFHGPTLSFKDFGAQFMAHLIATYTKKQDKPLHILVATSGDTGSAIGQAFINIPKTHVWILYPKGKVSLIQEKQLTTLGNNVTAVEIEGTFDDCQRLVKTAFSDSSLREQVLLTSANSINIARLIPQTFYYFYAFAQAKRLKPSFPLVIAVPSGNFGNLTAGLLAKKMGLPIERFIAATNINDSVPKYLKTGLFQPHPSFATIANAMDVGNPSNFERMLYLYQQDKDKMAIDIKGESFTDTQIKEAIVNVFEKNGYILDPHGAIGYLGVKNYLENHHSTRGVFLETAHPAKFADSVEPLLRKTVEIPESLQKSLSKEKRSVLIPPTYELLKSLLMK